MNIITRILLYDASYIVGFLLMLVYTLLNHNVYRINRARALVYTFITFLFGYTGAAIAGKLYSLISMLKGLEIDINVDMLGAVIFTSPFLLAAVSAEKAFLKYKEKKRPLKGAEQTGIYKTIVFRDTLDMMIPGSFLVFGCVKVGCFLRGCCWGVECSWGVKTPYINTTVFPIQIFESATIFAILIACFYIKQTKFFRRGMAGPMTALLYGIARFFWEFLRYNKPEFKHFFLGLTIWQIFSVLVIIVASIWLWVLYKTQPSEPLPKRKLWDILKAHQTYEVEEMKGFNPINFQTLFQKPKKKNVKKTNKKKKKKKGFVNKKKKR